MNVYCPRCKVTWAQRGNQTGHCAACHRTFASLRAFDDHKPSRHGCQDPSTLKSMHGAPLYRVRTDAQGAEVWGSVSTDERWTK